MPDRAWMAVTRPRRRISLAVRVAAVLAGFATVSVAVFAVIVFLVDRADVHNATNSQEQAVVGAMASSAEAAYQLAGGWAHADLTGVEDLAAANRFGFRLATSDGHVVAGQNSPAGRTGPTTSATVRVDGTSVAELTVTFPAQTSDERLLRALEHSVVIAGLVVVALAGLASGLLARPLTLPVRELTAVVRRRSTGIPVPEPKHPGPGEIGELSDALHSMIADLDRHEQLRRSLVADIAHELRTPIAVLQGETEALLDGVNELTPDATRSLHEEILRLARLVEDLQTLSAAQAARLDLRVQPVDLAEVAASAGQSQQRALRAAELTWESELSPVTVTGDPDRLHQIVTNLLTNAIKYTPAGGQVRLRVTHDDTTATLEVQDTGPGIPAEQLPHLFERFQRGNHPGISGTGIGLAVTKELVDAHHGTITITSPPLGGTRATVRLPRTQPKR